jgi:hypothetical protein
MFFLVAVVGAKTDDCATAYRLSQFDCEVLLRGRGKQLGITKRTAWKMVTLLVCGKSKEITWRCNMKKKCAKGAVLVFILSLFLVGCGSSASNNTPALDNSTTQQADHSNMDHSSMDHSTMQDN